MRLRSWPAPCADVATLADAQAALRRLAGVLRDAGLGHAGLHDALLLYASVRHWVSETGYAAVAVLLDNVSGGLHLVAMCGAHVTTFKLCLRRWMVARFASPTAHTSLLHLRREMRAAATARSTCGRPCPRGGAPTPAQTRWPCCPTNAAAA